MFDGLIPQIRDFREQAKLEIRPFPNNPRPRLHTGRYDRGAEDFEGQSDETMQEVVIALTMAKYKASTPMRLKEQDKPGSRKECTQHSGRVIPSCLKRSLTFY